MPPPEAQGRIHPASVYAQPPPLCLWVSHVPGSGANFKSSISLRSLTSNIFNVSFLNKVTFTDREFDVFGDGGFLHLEWSPLFISRERSSPSTELCTPSDKSAVSSLRQGLLVPSLNLNAWRGV